MPKCTDIQRPYGYLINQHVIRMAPGTCVPASNRHGQQSGKHIRFVQNSQVPVSRCAVEVENPAHFRLAIISDLDIRKPTGPSAM